MGFAVSTTRDGVQFRSDVDCTNRFQKRNKTARISSVLAKKWMMNEPAAEFLAMSLEIVSSGTSSMLALAFWSPFRLS